MSELRNCGGPVYSTPPLDGITDAEAWTVGLRRDVVDRCIGGGFRLLEGRGGGHCRSSAATTMARDEVTVVCMSDIVGQLQRGLSRYFSRGNP